MSTHANRYYREDRWRQPDDRLDGAGGQVGRSREQWALERGVTGAGFQEVADLTDAPTREQVQGAVAAAYPQAKPTAVRNFAAQMWALRDRMSKRVTSS